MKNIILKILILFICFSFIIAHTNLKADDWVEEENILIKSK